jgi:hypothetical protein
MVMSAQRTVQSPTGRGARGAGKRMRGAPATLFYRDGIQATGMER